MRASDWLVDLGPGAGDFYYRVAAVDLHENEGAISNEAQATSLTGTGDSLLPQRTALRGNHPNPFNPSTSIRFDLSSPGRVELGVYDLAGRLVKQLFNGPVFDDFSTHSWDGTNRRDVPVTSGVYFIRATAGANVGVRKVVLIR